LSPGVKVYEQGYSNTEKALFDYMAEYIDQPYVPEEEIDYGQGYDMWKEQREQLKKELREEILDELRKPQDEDTSKD